MFMLYVVFFLISNGHSVLIGLCTDMTYTVLFSIDVHLKQPIGWLGISLATKEFSVE